MDYFKEFVRNNAHLMIEFSKEGCILNASNFWGCLPHPHKILFPSTYFMNKGRELPFRYSPLSFYLFTTARLEPFLAGFVSHASFKN